jgi:RimJ/RimL family protein N-acetyltransferase
MYHDKKPVGWFRITPVDRWEANLGIVIFDPAYRYKEYGYNWVKDIMLPKVFPVFKVASWFTWDYNKASIGLAKKLGFELVDFTPNDRGSGATGLMFKLRGKE